MNPHDEDDVDDFDNAMEMIGWALIGATVGIGTLTLWWLFV